MRLKWREALPFAVAAAVLVLDQLSKAAVMRYLEPQVPWNPIAPLRAIVSLTYVTNTGAAFGLFPQLGNVYVVVALLIVGALLIFYRNLALTHRLMQVCLGLQLGGALGNLLDRLRFGHVIDFIDFKVWPVFNVADSSIVIGVVILAWLFIKYQPGEEPRQVDAAPGLTEASAGQNGDCERDGAPGGVG
ncbi:MAG: signal peptidase II [Anaerolineae bacterium]|nr:signal peptidase II [Anaerolineae bacterium]